MKVDELTELPAYRRNGRPSVTQLDVDRAADALMRQGERPSIEKVRERTGGSPNTLGPLLDTWWQRLANRVAVGPAAFERLPGSLAHIAEAFFLHALEEARLRAAQEQQREQTTLQVQQDDLALRSHLLSVREAELQQRLDAREQTTTALLAQLREQSLRIRKLQASVEATEARCAFLQQQLDARLLKRTAVTSALHTLRRTAGKVSKKKKSPTHRRA